MASLLKTASCIGIKPPFSVMRNFLGLRRGKVPQLTGAPSTISLLDQIKMLKGKHFHINIILVGSDLFTNADLDEVDAAVHKCRAIYKQQANLGVGRVLPFAITVAKANGRHIIDNDDEAAQLTDEWTVHNNALDVFIVRDYVGGTVGRSDIDGSCNKDKTTKMSGSVVEISNGMQQTARSFAHEIGHYLGLEHEQDKPDNLMCQSKLASSIVTSVKLFSAQDDEIRDHCFIHNGCQ
ncbi:M12 family metallo-peptidase [Nostoc sp. CHAB 5834]|nr:M12 family metallo-peptidase [Nostoc sp. CHAB 5834]